MKRRFFLYLVILGLMCSCAKQKTSFRSAPPPSPETIILPKTGKWTPPAPYEVNGTRYYPLPISHGFVQYGKASWYGRKFQGRPTSSGEPYDMHKMTAAHKTLPLGTIVRVTNLSNKKSTIVRINDRGPFVKGREIDLSYAAAKEIGLVGPGVTEVRVTALAKEVGKLHSKDETRPVVEVQDFQRGEFTIQVGAFQDKNNALGLADRLKVIYDYVNVSVYENGDGKTYYRVRASKSQTLKEAGKTEKRLEDMGFKGAFIVRI